MNPVISIHLNDIGKKFGREWIFRHLNYTVESGQKLVILGGNGSGKSTLLQVMSGFVTANEGAIDFEIQLNTTSKIRIQEEHLKNYISFASPYLQLIEDFSMQEIIEHIRIYKAFVPGLLAHDIIELAGLSHAKHKLIKHFSSGMKQRLKLALAILANTPLLLLDEPVSNLDKEAIAWYNHLVNTYTKQRTVIVCSNAIEEEYSFCDTQLNVVDYKMALKT